ncbi:unnamed protein product [Rotaria magnacalcarata]|uniref:C3H1-type domain-containing protein n=2 Tax=Rotaria magnacalcarata TaxID=392030 RepID=A0A816MW87_9BILA|nr:unnamed protein product [Rotaria magnacalcarata]
MASNEPKTKSIVEKIANLSLNENICTSTQTSNFYTTRNQTDKISFARLEKGLLLFIYIYETAKDKLAIEMTLWSRRLCLDMIKTGSCSKPSNQCHREHQSIYRQANLCPFCYIKNSCKFGTKCKNSHYFEETSKYHRFIRTETEMNVYTLIRFIRNFAGHYIDSAIEDSNDQQDLYKISLSLWQFLIYTTKSEHPNLLYFISITIKTLLSIIMVFQSAYYSPLVVPTSGCPSCSFAQASMVSRPVFYPPVVYYPATY